MKNLILALIFLSLPAQAGRESGGGDPCGKRIEEIQQQMSLWLKEDGARKFELLLPPGVTYEKYTNTMLEYFGDTKVTCVKKGDPGYPVRVEGKPKICRFDVTVVKGKKEKEITCDYKEFLNSQILSPSEQSWLIHHEYASMAGFEPAFGDKSTYTITLQVEKKTRIAEELKKLIAEIKVAETKYANSDPKVIEMKVAELETKAAQLLTELGPIASKNYAERRAKAERTTAVQKAHAEQIAAAKLAEFERRAQTIPDCNKPTKLEHRGLSTDVFETPIGKCDLILEPLENVFACPREAAWRGYSCYQITKIQVGNIPYGRSCWACIN